MPESLDNHLIDKGWNNMSAMLDDALPVRRKKRPVLPFLLLLAFGLTAAGVYFIPDRPAANQPATPALQQLTPAEARPQAKQEVPPGPVAAVKLPLEKASSNIAVAIPALETSHPAPVSEIVVAEPLIFSPFRGMDTLAGISPAPVQALTAVGMITPTISSRKSSSWRLGMEMGAGLQGQLFVAGPIVTKNLTDKLSIRTGLQLASSNYDLGLQASYLERFDTPDMTTAASGNSSAEALARSIADGQQWTVRTTAFQVPLVLAGKLHARFSLEAGLVPVFIFSKQSEQNQDFFGLATANFTQFDLNNTISASTRHIDLRLMTGIRYNLSPNWSLGVHYQHNVINLQRLDALQTRQDGLQLSVLGYF
jgi:opacity protein-like surface antigen